MSKIKSVLMLTFVLFGVLTANAKVKNIDLEIDPNTFLSNNVLYSNILLIDDRPEIEKKDIKIDVLTATERLNSLVKAGQTDKTLLIQINKLYLLTENGKNHYYIQARAYEKNNNKRWSFFWINTLNTSFLNQHSNKDTNKKISEILVTFVKDQLTQLPESYSPEFETSDFSNVSNLEKRYMYVYQNTQLKDGIYDSYSSFVNQQPIREISDVKFKKDVLKDVYYLNQGKKTKVKDKSIFGVVVDGNLFVQYGEGSKSKYIELYRDEDYNEFYFYTTKTSTNSVAIGVGFGLIGALLMPTNTTREQSRVVLDHLSGELTLGYKDVQKNTNSIFGNKSNKKVIRGDGSLKKSW